MSKRRNLATPNMADLSAHAARRPSGIMAMGHRPPEDINNVLAALNPALATLSERLEAQGVERAEISARLAAVEQMIADPSARFGGFGPDVGYGFSIGARTLHEVQEGEHAGFQHVAAGNQGMAKISLDRLSIRAALTTDGFGTSDDTSVPRDPQRGGFVGDPVRATGLLMALPHRPVGRDSVEYVQMESTGGPSEQIIEGTVKARWEWTGTLKTSPIITAAVWGDASRQLLSDQPALQRFLDVQARGALRLLSEDLVVNGGLGAYAESRLAGLIEQATVFIPTVGGNAVDIIGEAATTHEINGFAPRIVAVHPLDYHRVAVTKSQTEGLYLFNSPTSPARPSWWSMPVVRSASLPQGSALVIDTDYVDVLDREMPATAISTQHADYFVRNLLAVLTELRFGLEVRHQGSILLCDISASSESPS